MTDVSPAQVKGLWFHLVKAVGGVEAAGSYLGVSHQRISQIQSVNSPDLPTIMQIVTLEGVVGQPIVTGALARAAEGGSITTDPRKEIGDVLLANAEVLELERAGADARTKRQAALRLVREATEVADMYGNGGDAA